MTALFSLIGVVVGGLIGCLSAIWVGRFNARKDAGAKLRGAFASEIATMRLASLKHKTVDVNSLLGNAFPKHASAIEEYRSFVNHEDLGAYQQAWEKYYSNGTGSVYFLDYVIGIDLKPYELFLSRVQTILRFAKP